MNYEVYKNVRNASWQCLIDCKISSLPTSLFQICQHFGIKVVGNSKLTVNKLALGEKAIKAIINNQCYIIVDDTFPIPVQRYSIAHEIGHILLGNGESEAERFAIDVLAPACVLWGLNLHTAEDIARCNLSRKTQKSDMQNAKNQPKKFTKCKKLFKCRYKKCSLKAFQIVLKEHFNVI